MRGHSQSNSGLTVSADMNPGGGGGGGKAEDSSLSTQASRSVNTVFVDSSPSPGKAGVCVRHKGREPRNQRIHIAQGQTLESSQEPAGRTLAPALPSVLGHCLCVVTGMLL